MGWQNTPNTPKHIEPVKDGPLNFYITAITPQLLNKLFQKAQSEDCTDVEWLSDLHSTFTQVIQHRYEALNESIKRLDTLGQSIVDAAKRRKTLEQHRRSLLPSERDETEQAIQALQQQRDEILIPAKDQAKAQRDNLLDDIRSLKKKARILRNIILDRCGIKGVRWYSDFLEKSRVEKINRDRSKKGLPPLAIPIQPRETGVIKWFDFKKGFGFISADDGGPDLYANRKNLYGINHLQEGDRVEFLARDGRNGKRWAAYIIRI